MRPTESARRAGVIVSTVALLVIRLAVVGVGVATVVELAPATLAGFSGVG
jgi:hypothetical protein